MNRNDALLLRGVLLVLIATGAFYAWMRWFSGSEDGTDVEAAIASAALEGHGKRLHLLASALALFAVGVVWRTHVLARWRERRAGRSGRALAVAFAGAAVSGHVLQAIDAEGIRGWLGVVHAVCGAILAAGYLLHRAAVRRNQRAARAARA